MKRHFAFSDEQIKKLSKKRVTDETLFQFARKYDPGNKAPIGLINLLYYIDEKGDFTEKPFINSKLICKEIFENLGIKDKIQVHEYIEHIEYEQDNSM